MKIQHSQCRSVGWLCIELETEECNFDVAITRALPLSPVSCSPSERDFCFLFTAAFEHYLCPHQK